MSINESEQANDSTDKPVLPQYLLPASIQLQNALVVEISANRYPVEVSSDQSVTTNVNLEEIQIADDGVHAQVILSIQINSHEEPKLFDISFKVVGIFMYLPNTPKDAVLQFLSQGSLGVLLPFARELLMNLCTRLQIPIVILPMIQLTLPQSEEISSEKREESTSHE